MWATSSPKNFSMLALPRAIQQHCKGTMARTFCNQLEENENVSTLESWWFLKLLM
eukprot:m.265852 g.265852  ORF g.265852 m.265852 type:complete len:55 (+) comp22788_c0_seq6:57-221(+)